MMKKITVIATTLSIICALALQSCSQATSASGSGSASDTPTVNPATNTPGTNTPAATATGFTGTWKRTTPGNGSSTGTTPAYKNSYKYTKEITTTINSDGTYVQQTKTFYTSKTDTSKTWTTWDFAKGSMSVKDNVATFTLTNSFYSTADAVDPTAIAWIPDTTVTSTNIHIINNQLCFDALKRQDTGAGLAGTWVNVVYTLNSLGGKWYTKEAYTITGTTIAINYDGNATGIFTTSGSASIPNPYTFDGSSAVSYGPGFSVPYLLEGDWLFFGTGAVKQ